MIANIDQFFISPTEYLTWEEQQPFRYEYLNGEVYAMTGGTLAHNNIALNLASALKQQLRGTGCRVFINDVKVQVNRKGIYFYPDLVVTYNTSDLQSQKLIRHPCLIVEVLSPGTESYDRGDKFRQYRQMPSLKEYILIDPRKISVECYQLNENNKWELTAYSPEELADSTVVEFPSVEFECSIASIYEDIDFDLIDDE